MNEANSNPVVSAAPARNWLPTVPLGDIRVTRLICGGNPFRGNSHQNAEMGRDMQDYFTVARIKETLHDCQRKGINAVQARGDVMVQAVMREFRAEGGALTWIAQTASELRDLHGHVKQLARIGASAVYVHGTWVDAQFRDGRAGDVEALLKTIRDTGVVTGLGSHRPDIIAYAEDKDWDVDFYMCSMYNLSKTARESSIVSGKQLSEDELFDHNDKWAMLDVIRQTDKTCLAFKILGAGRVCATPEQVREAFDTVFQSIKPIDAVVVGMWPKYSDQVNTNVQIVRDILSKDPRTGVVK